MVDRRESLREEAARFLEAAKQSKDPNSRGGLIRLAAKFLELAGQPQIDIDAILAGYNAQQTAPVVQQPGQAQPDDDKNK
jgi:hypothetical protein